MANAFADLMTMVREMAQSANPDNNPNRQQDQSRKPETVTQATTPQQEVAMDYLVPQQPLPKIEQPEKKEEEQDNKEEPKTAKQEEKEKQRARIMGSELSPEDAMLINNMVVEGKPYETALRENIATSDNVLKRPEGTTVNPPNQTDNQPYLLSGLMKDYYDGDYLLSPMIRDYYNGDYFLSPMVRDYVDSADGNNKSGYNFTRSSEQPEKLWSMLTQREQFNQTMFDDDGKLTDFGQAIVDAYGDAYGNEDNAYEAWRSSNDRDLTSALFGYGDNEGKGIKGWQDLARRSGVEDLDGMMDYMWGDNAFNIQDYLANNDYVGSSNLGYSDDAAAAMANYIWQNYNAGTGLGPVTTNGVDLSTFDNAEDFATYALAAQMSKEAAANDNKIDANRYAYDRISDILGNSGEAFELGLIGDDGEYEHKDTPGARPYSVPDLVMGQARIAPYVNQATGEIENLDANLLDTYLSLLNASDVGKGKEIGIRNRKE